MSVFDFYSPLLDKIGETFISLEMIFNPYYPDHVKYRCKTSRKVFRRKR